MKLLTAHSQCRFPVGGGCFLPFLPLPLGGFGVVHPSLSPTPWLGCGMREGMAIGCPWWLLTMQGLTAWAAPAQGSSCDASGSRRGARTVVHGSDAGGALG